MGFIGDLASRARSAASNVVQRVEQKVDTAVETVKQQASTGLSSVDNYIHAGPLNTPSKQSLGESWDTAKKLWSSPNKGAALGAEYEIGKVKLTHPLGLQRLTPDMQKALVDGVSDPRSTDTDRGQRGILGKDQATRAAQTLTDMDGGSYEQVKVVLDKAGQGPDGTPAPGADAGAERALIMKAIAARSDRLKDPATAESAMAEVEAFAKDIRGVKRDELIRTTTATDVQGSSNEQSLKQHFENTCAPTVSQIARAETDPVYARELHAKGPQGVADDQRWLFNHTSDHNDGVTGRVPVARQDPEAYTKLDAMLLQNVRAQQGGIPPPVPLTQLEAQALSHHAKGQTLPLAEAAALDGAKRKLDSMGHADFNSAKLDELRQSSQYMGVSPESSLKINGLHDLNSHDVAIGGEKDATKAMKDRLEAGNPVPFSIAYKGENVGHALIATDYRDGKFLVSDPYSGKTAWVPENKLRDGSFAKEQFGLGSGNTRLDGYFAP